MRETILNKSAEMFLRLGFKSVTMDDLAAELGISKKTIYQHYKNKTELVEASVFHVFDSVCGRINTVCDPEISPIEELYQIKKVVREYFGDEESMAYNQLKKFYPHLFEQLMKKKYQVFVESVSDNLRRGIQMGLFREDIDIFFTSRMYFSGMSSIKDTDMFPHVEHTVPTLTALFLEYHLRAIVTAKGLEELNQFINEEKITQ
jgi:AcrR family transcriptional regulator